VPHEPQSLNVVPIGFVRTAKPLRFDARHQPDESEPDSSIVELVPTADHRAALRDLAGFTRVWLVWWFHLNKGWRPLVLPPRGPARRRGVLATRSPHRPNPLGLTAVRLLGVEGTRLRIGPCDLVDGTPILDIKPYIPAYDAFPDETAGWLGEVEAAHAAPPRFAVRFEPLADEQAAWLAANWRIDFRPRLGELLARDPSPHRGRRIRRRPGGRCEIGCGAWRATFSVAESTVIVHALDAGFPLRFLADLTLLDVPEREAQCAFLSRWPRPDGAG
jgi:tRNA-Thr(GGU) m(6)t(6)A37 methyltransferase TsaA